MPTQCRRESPARGRTPHHAVVPGLHEVVPFLARSYLREAPRYDSARESTTARRHVRPRDAECRRTRLRRRTEKTPDARSRGTRERRTADARPGTRRTRYPCIVTRHLDPEEDDVTAIASDHEARHPSGWPDVLSTSSGSQTHRRAQGKAPPRMPTSTDPSPIGSPTDDSTGSSAPASSGPVPGLNGEAPPHPEQALPGTAGTRPGSSAPSPGTDAARTRRSAWAALVLLAGGPSVGIVLALVGGPWQVVTALHLGALAIWFLVAPRLARPASIRGASQSLVALRRRRGPVRSQRRGTPPDRPDGAGSPLRPLSPCSPRRW